MWLQFLSFAIQIFLSASLLKPVVVNTWGSKDFQQANRNALGSMYAGRLYALVEGLSTCERLQCDTTVGYDGSPDENGETTLDALIVDGNGVRMGAVANLHRIKDAARVAWAVMNYTKHTLLVGESATRFAVQMGFREEDISSNVSRAMISDWRSRNCQPNFWQEIDGATISSLDFLLFGVSMIAGRRWSNPLSCLCLIYCCIRQFCGNQ
ncbi:asparaginase [Necator americanus]|uniref:Asparaginase n=1 Tax=Necator americanus TaxID=51031 RepID=W2TNX6_NECAM|nr:asparaginase [Necator americanus]ETN83483.1 asparaginase [Necator americanus]